ncbi:MAG TPA: CRISPR-associated endonuclease Cas3'' [Dehalococcoidia bacterium]|nr:CRISPR-associated endonuclease Cas3'' [Dehalococcoidia bacterium]
MNSRGERHDLVAHLRGVAELAAGFGSAFGAAETARYLGLWHDVGKFNQAFQDYLLECEREPGQRHRGPDHKGAGALLAAESLSFCSLAVQGHHGGLRAGKDLRAWLAERGADNAVGTAMQLARSALSELAAPARLTVPEQVRHDPFAAELYLRLLFSSLVDADYLDTERHFNPGRSVVRGDAPLPAELWDRFESSYGTIRSKASAAVLQVRRGVYAACLEAAEQPQGIFRLTVPTGGGKTLAAMAFALRHARKHALRRVIVAVPYISITEQTADVYRWSFQDGESASPIVLEHHSGVDDAESERGDFDAAGLWRRLAAENWDAPIIVTTTVQLFESLFGRKTSRSRKVHRLAGSVIILDEAQALPAYLLEPILDGLQSLAGFGGASVVISTATQPAFHAIPAFATATAREIVPEPGPLFAQLRRVDYDWRTEPALSWESIAELLRGERQALAVVNTKADALRLMGALGDPDALHLSTLLCGAHRRVVLQEVRDRLEAGEPCTLISTQVVEAGVDLDFPVVLRAVGPLDSVIQAAGRCNREGTQQSGRVIVFRPQEGGMPPGAYRAGAGVTAGMASGGNLDPSTPAASAEYFRQLFDRVDTDRERVQEHRKAFDFPAVAEHFRMIEPTESVVITSYGSAGERRSVRRWLDELRVGTPNAAGTLRRLQPFMVSIAEYDAERKRAQKLIDPILPGVGEWLGGYDAVRGLRADGLSPESLVI